MFNQQISGKHKRCPNRMCKAAFFKDSFCGYQPKSSTSVEIIMQCPKCGDVFAITQEILIVQEYMSELPCRPRKTTPITAEEHIKIKQTMEEQNILMSFSEEIS